MCVSICRGRCLSIAREGAAFGLASLYLFVCPSACPCWDLVVLLLWSPRCPQTLILSAVALPSHSTEGQRTPGGAAGRCASHGLGLVHPSFHRLCEDLACCFQLTCGWVRGLQVGCYRSGVSASCEAVSREWIGEQSLMSWGPWDHTLDGVPMPQTVWGLWLRDRTPPLEN